VLAPIFEHESDLLAVFTKRPESLRRHAGQISFPGGQAEGDDPDLVATALREAEEEIGLQPSAVSVIGALTPVAVAVSGFAIYPFVALIEPPARWRRSADEVEAVLELSLTALASSYRRQTFTREGHIIETDTFAAHDQVIWGATARILADLLRRIALLEAA
jgi:8-oxo-dGTP pyrophosphatase MutT (NUDIX family)